MEPLRDDMDYWINFFSEWKIKLNEDFAKSHKIEGSQVGFFDDVEENSL